MSLISEENKRAFSMWKMLNETLSVLIKGDCPEASVKKLVNIIQSKEGSSIFICYKDPTVTFQEYKEIGDRYKAFTTWILGQFFYLLGYEKIAKLHDIIIDAQLCILDKLSKTQLHVYHELSAEYCRAFCELVQYYKNSRDNIQLKVFVPEQINDLSTKLDLTQVFMEISARSECINMLKKLMKFVKPMLSENFTFYGFDDNTYKILDHLLLLLRDFEDVWIVDVIDIFIHVLQNIKHHFENLSPEIIDKFSIFFSLFEQLIYKVYDSQIILNDYQLQEFEVKIELYTGFEMPLRKYLWNVDRINNYIISKHCSKNLTKISPTIFLNAIKGCEVTVLEQKAEHLISISSSSNYYFIHCFKKQILRDIIRYESQSSDTRVFLPEVGKIWGQIHKKMLDNLENIACNEICLVKEFLQCFGCITGTLMNIQFEFMKSTEKSHMLQFFKEENLLYLFIKIVLSHSNDCKNLLNMDDILNFFIQYTLVTNSRNLEIIFNFLAYPLLKSACYKNENQFTDHFIGTGEIVDIKLVIRAFYKFLSSKEINQYSSLAFLKSFFEVTSSGLLNLNDSQMENIERAYLKITRVALPITDHRYYCLVIRTSIHATLVFQNVDRIISDIWNPILSTGNKEVMKEITLALPNMLCITNSDFIKVLGWDDTTNIFISHIACKKCFFEENATKETETILLENEFGNVAKIYFSKIRVEEPVGISMLNHILAFLSSSSINLKLSALGALPHFSSHVSQFHSANITRIWIELAGDQKKEVRQNFAEIVHKTVKFSQENSTLSPSIKTEILDALFTSLLDLTKKSLKFSEFDLQYSILTIIEEITMVKSEHVIIWLMKILFYLIMVPTSKYSLIAVNKCFNLAKANDSSTTIIYSRNKKDFCEIIVHLCSVNQALINRSLSTSLEKVSLMLGFYGSKDFVAQECNYLLPFFVSKIIKMPAVTKLIQEMALMMDMDISEMLACKYGYIFIHIFLDMLKDDFKQCMTYLEKNSGLSGPTLRKRNFRIILNELLLNFHEKRDRVTLALKLLADEDSDNKASSVQDYLQSYFLGVLLYFDVKLISKNQKKNKYLLSLADLFRYMGPKHIMPLRFKIIAMLQTTKYDNFLELNCEVWNAFIRTCEIESLGPQLASIFVSILPLLTYCPGEINEIFKYLIVENENNMKNYIADLFFVNSAQIDHGVLTVIKRHVKVLEKCNLKEKIQRFLKYITHEAMDVRIQGLKYLKGFLEQSREELDKMILDYNGIDSTIVELIDILTLGCREKNEALKLACGEVIGELGAIEPSHLPRRYAHDENSFSFYIDEDSFIISCLNELGKAFQTEKNTQNMDRYALAIQDILKKYEISPDPGMKKFHLWNEFPESQREVMLPLLSSRYMIAQPVLASNLPTPIYGSNSGASFHSWLYNWTCSLISSLPQDKKDHLIVCLPSMRQNHKILMHFLPYILLHVLFEGTDRIAEKAIVEIQTVTNSFSQQKTLDPKVLNLRPIPISRLAVGSQVITPEELKQMQCTKVVFLLLDFLDHWVREWQWQKGLSGSSSEHFQIIKHFLNELCKLKLAKCNYHCGEYPRALVYLEDYISENSSEMLNHLSFLAEIYAQIEEPDGVDGVTALQHNEPSVEQRILALEVSGKLADATTCYEKMLQPLKLHHIQGLVQCYLDLDNMNTALNFVRGALGKQPEFGNMLLELQAEPLWRLGQYDDLDDLLRNPDLSTNKSWGVQVGKALLSFKNGERQNFHLIIDGLLREQVDSFGAASLEEGAYQHGYAYISKLHALNELRQLEKVVNELLLKPNDHRFSDNLLKKLMDEWLLRLKVVQESFRTIEPLLCLRRVSLNLTKNIAQEKFRGALPILDLLIGECWIQSAKTARAAGMHQQAYTYTIKAEEYAPSTLFLEKAKLHWMREEHEQALTTLRRGLEVILPDHASPNDLSIEQRKICAKARLLIASYNEEISNVDAEMNLQHYNKAVEVYREWEKSMVCIAQYYDKIFQTYSTEERDVKGGDLQLRMINYFGKSLQYGTNYIYQSMPRLLSIWFDYGTRLLDVTQNSVKEERKDTLFRMTKLIDSFLERLPTYVFLTAFSQLVSRICHPQREVYGELKCIIIKLIQQYPQQSLWMIISVIKSSYAVRSKRCAEILCDSRLKTTSLTKLVKDFTSLAEKLIELCNKEISTDISKTSVNSLLRTLPRLLGKDDFSEIMMPTYKFRKLILPNPDFTTSQHNPFPNHYVHIVGIKDEVTILPSLQRPRKITLKGSDGKEYIFMLKPKDDLRKDFRLMEFNDIVNQLLAHEGEARQRRLNIRLYSVAPLNEECGLIEWVPNLVGLRPVLTALYKQKGLGMKGKELKDCCCNIRDSLDKKKEVFTKKLLPKHPPVLNEWFRKTFPDAQIWLTARTAYIRTTAVMSMAGYILGLGDRHGENISLDSTCGDVVHVDFNCLFNKGEKFDWPERVPFRLTHNMVAAMGPLGVEGIFRKSCACTLRVLRMNTNTLMSIVAPFVYDPLVSWPKNISALPNVHNAERTNGEAVDHIKNIELRLQGRVKTRHRNLIKPLSVEGQTNDLISEAVSLDNLCQMYIGWGPYL